MTHAHAYPPQPPPHRYDRQIRLWGDAGQAALQRASICLVNASALGTESLKNLVLPGIASFTIVDPTPLTPPAAAANFFLPPSPARLANRAHAACVALAELNPSVAASYLPHALSTLVRTPARARAFVARFSVVIATQLAASDPALRALAAACAHAAVPLLHARVHGLVAAVRVQAACLCVLDDREHPQAHDLRLHRPFEELAAHAARHHLSTVQDSTEAAHIPFVLILIHAVRAFRAEHHGRLPATREEKQRFKTIVHALRPPACPDLADNFEEACRNSNLRLCYQGAGDLPPALQAVLSDPLSDPRSPDGFAPLELPALPTDDDADLPEVIRLPRRSARPAANPAAGPDSPSPEPTPGLYSVAEENASFWVHAAAVRMFVEEHGVLPVRGSLPDMAADTESYVALQKLYSGKADADARQVLRFGQEILERHGLEVELDEASVRRFCKNLGGVRVVRTRTIEEELSGKGTGAFMEAAMVEGALDPSQTGSAAPYYALMRAVDKFQEDMGRPPQAGEADEALLYEFLTRVKEELGVVGTQALWRDECSEMLRYGDSELHNVCAFVGGVVAQEVSKIITKVFSPLQCAVFNLVEQRSVSFSP